jgi:hypothetical protein
MTAGQLNDNCEAVTVVLSVEVVYALETVSDRSALIERAIRRELRLPPGNHVGRPRKHSVEDLVDCLGQRALTSGEFQRRAAETAGYGKSGGSTSRSGSGVVESVRR